MELDPRLERVEPHHRGDPLLVRLRDGIRGFALILIIGVLTSMFTAVVVTRTILRGIVQADFARRASLWNVSEDEFLSRPAAGRSVRGEARGRV